MISLRNADLIDRIKDQREKLTLVVAIFTNANNDHCLHLWFYDNNGKLLSPILGFISAVLDDALDSPYTSIRRSFDVSFPDYNFSESLPSFVDTPLASGMSSVIYGRTMNDLYTAMKRGASYFVGESEHHFNDSGVCFGVIQLFKPKFKVGEYAKFKDISGQVIDGLIVGVDGGSGKYLLRNGRSELDVAEKDLMPSTFVGSSLISYRTADLLLNIQEKERQRAEADKIDKHPLDVLPEHPQINDIIKETVTEFSEKMQQSFETYGNKIKELPSTSSNGFHNYTNGGWSAQEYTILDYMVGSGRFPANDRFNDILEEQQKQGYKDAMDNFIADHKDELIKAGLDPSIKKNLKKINYHDLYEMDNGRLAEALSECESEALSQYEYTFYFKVFYYAPTNSNKEFEDGLPEIQVTSGVEGSFDLEAVDERFSFSTLSQLKEKLNLCLNQAGEVLR